MLEGSEGTSIGQVSIRDDVEFDARFLLLFRLGVERRRLPCRRSCAVAATTAREGCTPLLMDADDPERGIERPSRFSTGGSRRAIFGLRSSRLSKMNEDGLLGICSLAFDSPSLESLSKSAGYRSLIDLVGLFSARLVSVRAIPFSSTVSTTDVLCFGLPSDADPTDGRPILLTGEAVRGI